VPASMFVLLIVVAGCSVRSPTNNHAQPIANASTNRAAVSIVALPAAPTGLGCPTGQERSAVRWSEQGPGPRRTWCVDRAERLDGAFLELAGDSTLRGQYRVSRRRSQHGLRLRWAWPGPAQRLGKRILFRRVLRSQIVNDLRGTISDRGSGYRCRGLERGDFFDRDLKPAASSPRLATNSLSSPR